MISFPNCKINLGLNVTEKRIDGFHNIETVFYPVNWCDILEVIESKDNKDIELSTSGISFEGDLKDNLLYKAWDLISKLKKIPPVKIHLHKIIPMGAGIGGGSSDAAFLTNLLDKKFNLGLTTREKHEITSTLGSDCAFFLHNKPLFAQGRGNEFSPVKIDLGKYYLLLVYPGIHSNTREAFHGLTPKKPSFDLKKIIEESPVKEWKNTLVNGFDTTIMKKYPAIKELKDSLYYNGALYASMSGSGSLVYGIFENKPSITFPSSYKWYLQLPTS
ncbi:MAG: 4-(cytidine 5'-diphospho)-2-C-methyl-D-erythritol kinase [Bacteroidia bacterium]